MSIKSIFQENIYNIAQNILHSTEMAAIRAVPFVGSGKKNEADNVCVEAMREVLNQGKFNGKVVIGEGEMDEAPMLYIGEILGTDKSREIVFDIAVDPLEGTNLCANAMSNSISVIGVSEAGTLLNAPDVYMQKIAVGCKMEEGEISLEYSVEKNLKNIARAKNKKIEDLRVLMLDRPRHKQYVDECRMLGAKVGFISDGDILGTMLTTYLGDFDVYMGSGGAPEGVLSAMMLKVMGGSMCGKLIYENEEQVSRARKMLGTFGVDDINKEFGINEMVRSDNIVFAASGITDGWILKAPRRIDNNWRINSLLITQHGEHRSLKILDNYIFSKI